MTDKQKNNLTKISVCIGYGAAFCIMMALFEYVYNIFIDNALALSATWFVFFFIGGIALRAYRMWIGLLSTNHCD